MGSTAQRSGNFLHPIAHSLVFITVWLRSVAITNDVGNTAATAVGKSASCPTLRLEPTAVIAISSYLE